MDSECSVPPPLVSIGPSSLSQIVSAVGGSSTATNATTGGTTSDIVRFQQMLVEAMKDSRE